MQNSDPPFPYTTGRHRTVIDDARGLLTPGFGEIWAYRDLLGMLVWRDFLTRYRQSLLGIGWAIFRPLLSVLVFTVFTGIFRVNTGELPYPLFSLTGMIVWLYFSGTLASATGSVVNSGALLTKVYFPRLILPLSSVLSGFADVIIQLVLLATMMLWYRTEFFWSLLLAPLFLGLCVFQSLSLGLWLTALNVRYRDIGQAVPFILQICFFATPVLYPSSQVPVKWQTVYSLNPLVCTIEGFRWSVLGTAPPSVVMIASSSAMTCLVLVSGLYYFRRVEDYFADTI
jgi:lipopolysaccharide transport system permease protein